MITWAFVWGAVMLEASEYALMCCLITAAFDLALLEAAGRIVSAVVKRPRPAAEKEK